eukprot:TRINITY_DN24492_c0_g1_i1.p1 TRINITY_DN24492_c0_g1~~TRINITY_DN24492_c0_g1_i1.p1  ORF type:complete len:356 (-),score=54.48 TRINITY_DN24492_c0_g1_i1:227-1294(-)
MRASRCIVVVSLLAMLLLSRPKVWCPLCFAPSSQVPLRIQRMREGLGAAFDDQRNRCNLTLEEKMLIAQITQAGNSGDWHKAKSVFKRHAVYSPDSSPVFNAMMTVALRCGKYVAGHKIYDMLGSLGIKKSPPSYSLGLRLAAKSNRTDAIENIWMEAVACDMVNMHIAGARLDAAAAQGDIETAAKVLDLMENLGMVPNRHHFTAAICACHAVGRPGYSAAVLFLDAMLQRNVTPDIVTYAALVKAHQNAPLEAFHAVLSSMEDNCIGMNCVFLDVYLHSLLDAGHPEGWRSIRSMPEILGVLRSFSDERLHHAAAIIQKAHVQKIKLSGFCNRIDEALEMMCIGPSDDDIPGD